MAGTISGAGADRPNSIPVTVGAGVPTKYSNLMASIDGEEWDTVVLPINIPAGVTSLTVQVFSRDDADPVTGNLPASLAWVAASLALPPTGQGCTPEFWKQEQHFADWPSPYTTSTLFSAVFENAFPARPCFRYPAREGED